MLERDALSVSERFVLVLVHVSATARVPASEIAALDVVNAAPLTAVPPAGRIRLPPSILTFPAAPALRLEEERVPPVEERVPLLTVIPPLRDKSAFPLIICSVAASSVTACFTFSPAIWLFSVSAKFARSSVPTESTELSLIVALAPRRSVLVLSGTTPLRSCVPCTSRILLLFSENALLFVVKVVLPALSVEPLSESPLCRTSVLPGIETVVPEDALPPEESVIVPPVELS